MKNNGESFRVGAASVEIASAGSLLTPATGFMGEYDYTLNPYGGCSFGCSYCYAAFFSRDQSLQDNWGKWVKGKKDAAAVLDRKLRRDPRFLDGKRIYMSSVTDPYQPTERVLQITREVLSVMAGEPLAGEQQPAMFGNSEPPPKPKLVVQTRSPDVVRDVDLFRKIEQNGGRTRVNMTVTTDDEMTRRAFEPSCPSNAARLRAVRELAEKEVDVCVTMTPLIWVENPQAFAESLLETGADEFVAQPFHLQRGKFVASTREDALAAMARKLGCAQSDVMGEYLRRYKVAFRELRRRLPSLGEGKKGFAPPF